MENEKFLELTNKYGPYGSWAIWDDKDFRSTLPIFQNIPKLHSRFIIAGLNRTGPGLNPWTNFRAIRRGCHDRKLKYALNIEPFIGAYMTDIIKNSYETDARLVIQKIENGSINIAEQVEYFNKELSDVGANNDSVLIFMGQENNSKISKVFKTYFKDKLEIDLQIKFHRHYSSTLTSDREWVKSLWSLFDLPFDDKMNKIVNTI